jgi:hypothetical protein
MLASKFAKIMKHKRPLARGAFLSQSCYNSCMSLHAWNTNHNGAIVGMCQNSRGNDYYLYETEVNGQRIYTWQREEPGRQESRLQPTSLPSGFVTEETEKENQPVLRKL